MKKTVCLLICLSIAIFCSGGCGGRVVEKPGFSNFNVNDSMFGICGGSLRLGKTVQETYEYIEGDYYFSSYQFLPFAIQESSLIYLVYTDAIYEEAKQFVIDHFEMSSDLHTFTYNDYTFYTVIVWEFPLHHTLLAYNDEKNTLVFMGFYISSPLSNRDQEILQMLVDGDIEPFLKEYFSFYDFSK